MFVCGSTSVRLVDDACRPLCTETPLQAHHYYNKKKRPRAGANGGTNEDSGRPRVKEAKQMSQVYVTMKILLAGLQIISTAGFNLGVDFPPMVPSKDPGQITY